jgi:hypothetical protein
MKNFIATCIIAFSCVVGSFLGIIVYELVSDFLYSGTWTWAVLTSSFFQVKVVSILTATLLGAIGQEIIIPIQHKFTFWRYIRQRSMLKFSLVAGLALGLSGALAILISIFLTEKISLADGKVFNRRLKDTAVNLLSFVKLPYTGINSFAFCPIFKFFIFKSNIVACKRVSSLYLQHYCKLVALILRPGNECS